MCCNSAPAESLKKRLYRGMLCLGVALVVLSGISLYGLYTYRSLVKSLSRMDAFRRAAALIESVNDLRVTVAQLRTANELEPNEQTLQEQERLQVRFLRALLRVQEDLNSYRRHVESVAQSSFGIGGSQEEQQALWAIERTLRRLQDLPLDRPAEDPLDVQTVENEIARLQTLTIQLPRYLRRDVLLFTHRMQRRFRPFFLLAWLGTGAATLAFLLLIRESQLHLVRPLQQLLQAAQRLAAGRYQYRLRLHRRDEMAELAAALNLVAEQFCQIQEKLERKVQQWVQRAGRSDRLAGVGMLAAGVSHELNNPLASIAMSAEALERRLRPNEGKPVPEHLVPQVRRYLGLIQSEAARCHRIVHTLLEPPEAASSTGASSVALAPLVEQAVTVLGQLEEYRQRRVELRLDRSLRAPVDPAQWKQVVMNLVLNALQATGPEDRIRVELTGQSAGMLLTVEDTGCGFDAQRASQLFEPFFTNRRDGQGTGLGLFLVHRTVQSWGGQIQVHSDGPGRGARFQVLLPHPAQTRDAA